MIQRCISKQPGCGLVAEGTMGNHIFKNYQKGFDAGQARIGIEVARNWSWPYAYDEEDLLKAAAQPDFDPQSRYYCFDGDEMVGFMSSAITPAGEDQKTTATLEFPRMLHGYERAAPQLLEWACEALARKGVTRLTGRVTTMCPSDIRVADTLGFTILDWGYKVYYSYEMGWGKIDLPVDGVEEIDPSVDLGECATLAANWYKRPAEWCLETLRGWHEYGIITHRGVREAGGFIAACLTAANVIRPTTAANYYIYTPDDGCLKALLASVVGQCIDQGVGNLIADLVNDHRSYEPVYQELGFKKVAEWAHCEKTLAGE